MSYSVSRFRFSSPVPRICGWLLLLESIMLLLPLALALIEHEADAAGFLVAVGVSAAVGLFGALWFRHTPTRLTRRDAYLLITVIWILFSLVSMIPFMMASAPLDAPSAFFESISGFTTTGATTISDVEGQSRAILLWRAMTQWLGGLGIVLFLIALLPALNDSGGIMMFNAEITGMTHDKLHPRIKQTAMSIWLVYGVLTLLLIMSLLAGGMSFFDSVCQAMATLSTGGFSTRNASIAAWGSPYIATVIALFMTIGGMNFILLYNACRGRWRELWSNDILRVYLSIILVTMVAIGVSAALNGHYSGFGDALVSSFFHVSSAITSTGFCYSDFSAWGSLAVMLTILLMVIGACAGSTTGAIKVDRIAAAFKSMRKQLTFTIYPNHISHIKIGGKEVTADMMLRLGAFIGIYLTLLTLGSVVMASYGYDPLDSLFSSASCVGNNGLGYGATGSGFGTLPAAVKWLFSAEMLIGRLEIFTVLALFLPSFWRK